MGPLKQDRPRASMELANRGDPNHIQTLHETHHKFGLFVLAPFAFLFQEAKLTYLSRGL